MVKERGLLTFLLVSLIICTNTFTVQAQTRSDLFDYYEIPVEEQTQFTGYDILISYQEAQRFLVKYAGVQKPTENLQASNDRLNSLQSELLRLEDRLNHAYDLSFAEITSLESEYVNTLERIRNVESSLQYKETNLAFDFNNVPSRGQYLNARKELDEYLDEINVGTVPNTTAVIASKEQRFINNTVWYFNEEVSTVVALYNAVCISTGDTVVLQNSENITITYLGVESCYVKVGDKVEQGQPIGKYRDSLGVSLKLADTYVDFTK